MKSKKWHEAYRRAQDWLYKANIANERKNIKREDVCLRKAQYWLDRLNKLDGLAT